MSKHRLDSAYIPDQQPATRNCSRQGFGNTLLSHGECKMCLEHRLTRSKHNRRGQRSRAIFMWPYHCLQCLDVTVCAHLGLLHAPRLTLQIFPADFPQISRRFPADSKHIPCILYSLPCSQRGRPHPHQFLPIAFDQVLISSTGRHPLPSHRRSLHG